MVCLGVTIVKIKKPGFENTPIDWVLLSNSPKLNLDDLIENLQPKCIIAYGSNYTTCVERWGKTYLKYKIRFHDSALKEPFVFNIEPSGSKTGHKRFLIIVKSLLAVDGLIEVLGKES